MFSLINQTAKIASFNPRAEKHGDENVPAADIKFQANVHSSALDSFHKGLRTFLFRKAGAGEQDAIPFNDGDDLIALAFPKMKPIRWDEDFPGYELVIATELGLTEALRLGDVELCKFEFDPIEGGSVRVSFSAHCQPDAAQAGALCQLIQEDVELTLTPPGVEQQAAA